MIINTSLTNNLLRKRRNAFPISNGMNIKAVKNDSKNVEADIFVIGAFFGLPNFGAEATGIDKLLGGMLALETESANFIGGAGEFINVGTVGKIPAKRLILLGLGDFKTLNAEVLRRAFGSIFKNLKGKRFSTLAVSLRGISKNISSYECAKAIAEGALLASYEFNKYKGEARINKKSFLKNDAKEVIFLEKDRSKADRAFHGAASAQINSQAVCYARDLVNEPASICIPAHLVTHARAIAKAGEGKIKVKIFNREECKKRGMDAFLSVASGAGEEPYFIHLIYKGQNAKRKIALVGKGITFDSGGLQIKPGESMATMKLDMAGAAAVLGVFSKIVEISPRAEVHGIIAATENMPGARAYKPGDIVRASNGKTIEIGHTDAEGRVTLADSLAYAAKLKPDAIIDLATLTGACMVALGEEVAGLMSNSKKLADALKESSDSSGEKLWELPLVNEYRHLIKGTHADVRNSGASRYGGAITAGLFLEEFVGKIPWAHLDIAGPAWAEKETISYTPLGGTGYGVRTLIDFLKNI